MRIYLSFLLALALAVSGCSFSNSSGSISDSSGSISDSISSPSKSSSDSSDDDDSDSDKEEEKAPEPESTQDKAAYQQNVSQLTLTYLKSGGDIGAFRSGIANLAKARGITNWEVDAVTTQAIGTGAGNAGLQEAEFEAFSKQLVGDDLQKLNELRIGYQKSAPAKSDEAASAAATSATTPEAS
jgi:hypothetical protein